MADWTRVKDLFARALEQPAPERETWLAREAAGDDELLREVQSLIASHEAPGVFLTNLSAQMRVEALSASGSQLGERIGAYRLVELIGTGGMGDVFKAVRDDDQYQAEVAIKLMRGDVRNPLVEQRFKTERQILAQLDHRNIARLLDGGTTAGGLPYVVMELVVGAPIDQYSASKQLTTRERVQLFLQVCTAVSYAHRHLVVHRDLKPNNILVTADGSVKLLDFGIAKLLENDPATGEPTDETRTQFRAMTLEYASPEQVSGGTITTASDVYSLGVVLYRLVTEQSPYRTTGGDAARVAEILGETTPTRPSAAAARTQHAIEDDLDNILLMALRKEPAKRYGSVEQFANDLQNLLAGLPVSARRGTFAYRAGKYMRRHKVPIAAAVIVALSLIGGLGFAWREARIAERERVIAQRHFDSVRKLANRLFDFHDLIAELPGATHAREQLVTTSLEYLDTLFRESGTDRSLQEELGVAYRRVADIQGAAHAGNTGDTKGAAASYARSVALLKPLYEADPRNHRVGMQLAKTYGEQGLSLIYSEGVAAARQPLLQALALAESMHDGFADAHERAALLVNVYWGKVVAVGDDDPGAGMDALARMIAVAEEYSHGHPDDSRGYTLLSKAYGNGAIALDPRIPLAEALDHSITLARKGMAADEKLAALHPGEVKYVWSLAETRYNLGNLLSTAGRDAEAVPMFTLAKPVLAARTADASDANARLISLMNDAALGWALYKSGRPIDAETTLRETEQKLVELGKTLEHVQVTYILGRQRVRLGLLYAARAEADGASAATRRENWRKARAALEPGLAGMKKVNTEIPFSEDQKAIYDEGVATLARAGAG